MHRVAAPDELLDEAHRLARDQGQNVSLASMATIERQVLSQSGQAALDAMREADELMRETLTGADVREGISSFLEKRPPPFATYGAGTTFEWMEPHDG